MRATLFPNFRLAPTLFVTCPRAFEWQVKGAAHSTFEKAKEVNEEHRVMDKAKAGASRAWERIREVGGVPLLSLETNIVDRKEYSRAFQHIGMCCSDFGRGLGRVVSRRRCRVANIYVFCTRSIGGCKAPSSVQYKTDQSVEDSAALHRRRQRPSTFAQFLVGEECARLCDHGLPRMFWSIDLM